MLPSLTLLGKLTLAALLQHARDMFPSHTRKQQQRPLLTQIHWTRSSIVFCLSSARRLTSDVRVGRHERVLEVDAQQPGAAKHDDAVQSDGNGGPGEDDGRGGEGEADVGAGAHRGVEHLGSQEGEGEGRERLRTSGGEGRGRRKDGWRGTGIWEGAQCAWLATTNLWHVTSRCLSLRGAPA